MTCQTLSLAVVLSIIAAAPSVVAFIPSRSPFSISKHTTSSVSCSDKLGDSTSQRTTISRQIRLKMSQLDATTGSGGGEDQSRRAIVVIGLNGALQRSVVFKPPKGLKVGSVNRAASVGAGIGGKGQNVCVALRLLAKAGGGQHGDGGNVDVTLAHFAGGKTGEAVCENLEELGVNLVTSKTAAEMRMCTSLVDERFGETTELIEPWSAEISQDETKDLLAKCKSTFDELPKVHGVAVMGSIPAGVGKDALADIMDSLAESSGFATEQPKVLVDSVPGFEALIDSGRIGLLKVNAEEVVSLAEIGREDGKAEVDAVSVWMEDKLNLAAAELFVRYGENLPWIAVTNGGLPSYVFSLEKLKEDKTFSSFWRIRPASVEVVNPIGAGDATAAATLYEWSRGTSVPEAFMRGLSVGGASCVSRDPLCNSCFEIEKADSLFKEMELEEVKP